MATDTLVLGGFVFTDFAVPEKMPFGGRQAMAVHKLPGGSRVIDTLGPDEADITWTGRLWGSGASEQAIALDQMRAAGSELPLSYGGLSYTVVIAEFKATFENYPQNVTFTITCTVVTNASLGGLDATDTSPSALISADLSSAMGIAGL